MRKIIFFLFLGLVLILDGCSGGRKSNNSDNKDSLSPNLQVTSNNGNPIDYESTKVLKVVYVTHRDSILFWDTMNASSKPLGSYRYGDKLNVIKFNGDWIGVRERITRVLKRPQGDLESSGWEKVYVRKSDVGELSKIKLEKEDLLIGFGPYIEKDDLPVETGEPINKYLDIDLIDKSVYDNKHLKNDYLILDSSYCKKRSGVLELKAKNKTVQLKDKQTGGDDESQYEYLGYIPDINQFLIAATYWENQAYFFYDMTTGKKSIEFHDFPYISKDRNYIASLYFDPYGLFTEFDLFQIKNGKFTTIVRVTFANWVPTVDDIDGIFWTDEDELLLRVSHIAAYWKEDGNLNNQYQYIGIKLK